MNNKPRYPRKPGRANPTPPNSPAPARAARSTRLDPARDCVTQRLVAQATRFPDLDLSPLDTTGLTDRDAAFAHAIYDAAIDRWVTLVWLIDQRLRDGGNGVEPAVKGVLLAGAAQLLFLSRVPPHAAIDEAVKWAKFRIREGAAGIINAVLRRIAEMVYPVDHPDAIPPEVLRINLHRLTLRPPPRRRPRSPPQRHRAPR